MWLLGLAALPRCRDVGDAVPYGRFAVPIRRAGPMCPAAAHAFSAGHAGPALQGTGRVRADRVVRPYSGSRSRAKRDVVPKGHLFRCVPLQDAVPYERSPYSSVGRDPCVPPHDMHFFLPAGHAGPALQSAAITRRHGRTVCTSRRFDDGRAQEMCLYCAFRRTGSTI